MPPKKKKPDSVQVGIYNVDLMNEEELKVYIEALKQESERTKTVFINHQKQKKELEDLLKNTQEDILDRYEILIQKEIEVQHLLCHSNDVMKEEGRHQMIMEIESNKDLASHMLDNFTEVQMTKMFQRDSRAGKKDNLQDRAREVDHIKFLDKLVTENLEEETEEKGILMREERKKNMGKVSEDFVESYHITKSEFLDDKTNELTNIWEEDMDNFHNNPLADQSEKMSFYFKELFWKNITASVNLKIKETSLEKELNKLQMLLRVAEREHKELLATVQQPDLSPQVDTTFLETKNLDDERLNYLIFENDTLKEKLRQITEERDVLKNRFLSTMRGIYQKADFANFLAEQMILSVSNNQNPSDSESPYSENSKTSPKQNEQNVTSEEESDESD
ncbi:uncharacterized protein CDAR_20871 [Caerostris darwini]|uniref:Uncharacterized protein n=1 Tax=Caerostris darwini TaxID=1538125 RepID=A0AAV4N0H4_9ARAC|nr:uncharacterized protein CDAR_20871 [Caerostris darwini]